ncbi:delta-lactam-biosynthetic de-N-acetylase [Heliophilum fasciatum]|uniref:Peptidoglycan-N-acetylmuramic acid deacetylase n=1 Tax=Heliophilum fasciatum TaxID=35700 RepID=A0A4R2RKY8_9FIRM|nr:polysaccharide deacetylase family protein [Heliophilum fasciatum]MCW2278344.1 peptidoglycan-N-acetylmuramic acid deacetylase [Heliophilum fasciatum]TCP63783.1 peptidoglycan-N-acetylmuramic acid deacetylase [Heliophilum fasciatum]
MCTARRSPFLLLPLLLAIPLQLAGCSPDHPKAVDAGQNQQAPWVQPAKPSGTTGSAAAVSPTSLERPAPPAATPVVPTTTPKAVAVTATADSAVPGPALPAQDVPVTAGKDWWIPSHRTGVAPLWPRDMVDPLRPYQALYHIPDSGTALYLTFDEGYENGFTPQILDTLSSMNVPATFFVTGQFVNEHPDLVRRMAELGFAVGNHSYDHPDMTTLDDEKQKAQFNKLSEKVAQLTGRAPRHYRPPMGRYNLHNVALAHDLGMQTVFWSIAYKDWEVDRQVGATAALPKVLKQLHPGAVILLHAVSEDNAMMLPQLINECRAQGYTFQSLPVQ